MIVVKSEYMHTLTHTHTHPIGCFCHPTFFLPIVCIANVQDSVLESLRLIRCCLKLPNEASLFPPPAICLVQVLAHWTNMETQLNSRFLPRQLSAA